MRAQIIMAFALCAAACSQTERSKKDQSTFILQCDGQSVLDRGQPSSYRAHYEINLAAQSMRIWNPDKQQWNERSDNSQQTVKSTPTTITINEEVSLDDYSEARLFIFNRTLATVSQDTWAALNNRIYHYRFEGKCIPVEAPSNEQAF